MPGSKICPGKSFRGDSANRSYKESTKGFQGRTEIQPALETKTVCGSKGSCGVLFDEVSCSCLKGMKVSIISSSVLLTGLLR